MEKSTQSQTQSSTKFLLSHGLCENTFKNILRGQPSNHKAMPFKETTKKKDEFTNIFDDSYKYSPPLTEKKKENTMKIFTTGELKSNIKSNHDDVKRFTHLREKKNIETVNPCVKKSDNITQDFCVNKDLPPSKNLNNPVSARFLNDTFNKNPMAVITKDEQLGINNNLKEKLNSRTQKISNYLGSSGIKSSVLSQNYSDQKVQVDKITNVDIATVNNSRPKEPIKAVKAFKHAYVSKRMFLME